MMGRPERAELDLDELGRRKFEFVPGLGRRVVTIALAEAADAVDGEFHFTLEANAGPGGKSENILVSMSFQELASSARAAPHHPKTQATAQRAMECGRPDCILPCITSRIRQLLI
jgi:hypothetical protein